MAAAVSLALLAASSGLAAPDGTADTVAPDFGNVPACHIEAYPTATATATCTIPAVTGIPTVASSATDTRRPLVVALPQDMVGGSHTITWTGTHGPIHATGVMLQVGNHKATWTATDDAGNTATVTQLVIVSDTKPPVFAPEPQSEVSIRATGPTTEIVASEAGITPADASGTFILKSNVTEVKAGETKTVLWTARDLEGNTARVRQVITAEDRDAPSIIPARPPPVTLGTSGTHADITAEAAGVRVEDYGKVDPSPTLKPDKKKLPIGTHTVTWTARDSSGHTSTATQRITVVKFEVTSLAQRYNVIDITFSRPVDASSTSGIIIGKWGQIHANLIGSEGLSSTITTAGNTVSIVPTQTPRLLGTWVVSLPGDLSSTEGSKLYTAPTSGNPLYKDGKPKLESCIKWDDTKTDERTRKVADVPGCVGLVNSLGRTPTFTTWTLTDAPGSAPPNVAPLLRATTTPGTDRITLDWKLGSARSASYTVERSVTGGTFAPTTVAAVNATMATYMITEADLGSSLSFRVTETTDGTTTRSNAAPVSVPAKPAKPMNFNAKYSSSGNQVILEWDHVPIASGYRVVQIYDQTEAQAFTVTDNAYTLSLRPDRLDAFHWYYVQSYIGSTYSNWSSLVGLDRDSSRTISSERATIPSA